MKKYKDQVLLFSVLGWIVLSVASMFLSVISYTPPDAERTTYALQDIIGGTDFYNSVLSEYTGPIPVEIGTWALTALCILAIASILAASVGVVILSRQRPTKWPYIMTLIGTVGTAIPSLLIFASVFVSLHYFPGRIGLGFYPIVTPIAMGLCFWIVVAERHRTMRALKNQSSYIHRAGDL